MSEITTAGELDALPVGSVVLDRDADAWQQVESGVWNCVVDVLNTTSQPAHSLAAILGPLHVIYRPDQPIAAERARWQAEALREAAQKVYASSWWADGSDNYASKVRGWLTSHAATIESQETP